MAESKRDYYEVLGVSRDADEATLKKAFRESAVSEAARAQYLHTKFCGIRKKWNPPPFEFRRTIFL